MNRANSVYMVIICLTTNTFIYLSTGQFLFAQLNCHFWSTMSPYNMDRHHSHPELDTYAYIIKDKMFLVTGASPNL